MIKQIYTRAFNILMKKPLKLWGVVMLGIVLTSLFVGLSGIAIPAVGLAINMLMGTALTMVFLRGYRGEEVTVNQLFFCFQNWQLMKRITLGLGWAALWIFLWGLIPVVGPIFALIRLYEYRLTPYILVTEPEVSIQDAIQVSKQRTEGYKMQMFLADFLFALIYFGACIPGDQYWLHATGTSVRGSGTGCLL